MFAAEPLGSGSIIRVPEGFFSEGKRAEIEEYTVLQSYTHHVLCKNPKGIRRCFTNAELMTLGLVKQEGEEYEVQKAIVNLDGCGGYGGKYGK